MAGRPLRPATDRRLGRPLPHQLPNLTSAAPIARGLAIPAFTLRSYAVLATAFAGLSPRLGTFRCITHPFATRHQVAPCYRSTCMCKGMPPAFNLSQDQTLQFDLEFCPLWGSRCPRESLAFCVDPLIGSGRHAARFAVGGAGTLALHSRLLGAGTTICHTMPSMGHLQVVQIRFCCGSRMTLAHAWRTPRQTV